MAAARGDEDGEELFVIGELSRRSGITVRSLRSYQTQGLLPPPLVRGRTGFYGARHLARIELIRDLQQRGMKLSSIAELLDDDTSSDENLLRFRRLVSELFDQKEGAVIPTRELAARFEVSGNQARTAYQRSVRMNLVRDVGDGLVEELEPGLLASGALAQKLLGLGALDSLDVLQKVRSHVDAVAKLYMNLYLRQVWTPFVAEGQPADRWPDIEASIEELRRLAADTLLGAFEQAIGRRINELLRDGLRPVSSRR